MTTGIELATERPGLRLSGRDTRAVGRVARRSRPASRVAIIGQNGSGKSTLVRHFNGLLRATEGRVLVDGQPVGQTHVADLARQGRHLVPEPRSADLLGQRARGGSLRAAEHRPAGRRSRSAGGSALDQVGLARSAETPIRTTWASQSASCSRLRRLSRWARRRSSSTSRPPARTRTASRRVKRIVDELRAEGRTVVAISHDMTFVAEAFERVIVLRDGRVVLDGTVADVFGEPRTGASSSRRFSSHRCRRGSARAWDLVPRRRPTSFVRPCRFSPGNTTSSGRWNKQR